MLVLPNGQECMPYLTERKENATMSKEENQAIVDPIVLAAMIEDPNEDEDTKQLRKDILGTDETSGKATVVS